MNKELDQRLTTTLGENIKRHRGFRLITQEELANMAHTSQKMLSRFELGLSLPNAIQVFRIAKGLDCTVEALFSEKGQ